MGVEMTGLSDGAPTAGSADRAPERVRLSRARMRIATNMVRSLAVSPHVTISVDVDYQRVERSRRRFGPQWRETHGLTLPYLPYVAHMVCEILSDHPDMNATVEEDEEGCLTVVRHRAVNLGIAVDLDGRGLIVPVIRDADLLSPATLALAIASAGAAARERRLRPDDVKGGTFTITSPGRRAADRSDPIIHQPQAAILSIDAIRSRPVASPDGTTVVVHPVGALSLSFDHRVMDGVQAMAFLRDLQDELEGAGVEELRFEADGGRSI